MTTLADLGREIGEIAERVGPSVVGIGNRWRGGSGVVIAENRVLTNAHNLHGDEVTVTFGDGRSADASVLGVDADGDVAVLEVATEGAPAFEIGAEAPAIGSPVVALGNPNGQGPRVTFGFVSGVGRSFRGPRGRRVSGAVEHTAALAPGSSGGPIVDLEGRLVGINTNRLGSGFYQAIVADAALGERVAALGTRRVADATAARRRAGAGSRRATPATRRRAAGARRPARARGRGGLPRRHRGDRGGRPHRRRRRACRSRRPTTCSTPSRRAATCRSRSCAEPRSCRSR